MLRRKREEKVAIYVTLCTLRFSNHQKAVECLTIFVSRLDLALSTVIPNTCIFHAANDRRCFRHCSLPHPRTRARRPSNFVVQVIPAQSSHARKTNARLERAQDMCQDPAPPKLQQSSVGDTPKPSIAPPHLPGTSVRKKAHAWQANPTRYLTLLHPSNARTPNCANGAERQLRHLVLFTPAA